LIAARAGLRVWVATQPVDFRRGMNGLAALVAQTLGADPYGGEIFVFRSKRADRIKLLAWDGTGMILATNYLSSHYSTFDLKRGF
jgi:transposase